MTGRQPFSGVYGFRVDIEVLTEPPCALPSEVPADFARFATTVWRKILPGDTRMVENFLEALRVYQTGGRGLSATKFEWPWAVVATVTTLIVLAFGAANWMLARPANGPHRIA